MATIWTITPMIWLRLPSISCNFPLYPIGLTGILKTAMHNIFLSYRRSDSEYATARVQDHLEMYFGRRSTFRDVDGMYPGENFPAQWERQLTSCQIAIVVIGPEWVRVQARDGSRRLDDPSDYVRVEVRRLLARKTPIIPVLIGNAGMPRPEELPEDLSELAYIHAISLPPSSAFNTAIHELVSQIHLMTELDYEEYPRTLRQCQDMGLVVALDSFLDDTTLRQELRTGKELIVVMNDGRNFVHSNQEIFRKRLTDPRKQTSFVFYHPLSEFLPTLLLKNQKEERQLREMKASFDLLRSFGAKDIRGHHLFNPYSLTMSENYAFISPYRFNEGGALPLFKFTKTAAEGYYFTLRTDVLKLIESSEILESSHFEQAEKRAKKNPRYSKGAKGSKPA